ncbi:hypothetical protein BJY54_000295 [Streptomyces nodosus]|nr:hypothetical protein [Streptomyces nodosus]
MEVDRSKPSKLLKLVRMVKAALVLVEDEVRGHARAMSGVCRRDLTERAEACALKPE